MLAFLWGVAWGAGAFLCLRAATGRILKGNLAALPLMAANLALIGGCLAVCALISPESLAWTGGGLAAALILGTVLQSLRRAPASSRKEDAHD
ncbi:MAG: hypothetical protein VB051_03135 [Candidatus Pelethousia sp.]|nr:hypothetical protein [Candidatus Pelethousia sp.]